jgi:Flp pilus assembly protein TadB
MPPAEFEDRQQARREQEMMHARKKVKVYAVLMVLLWAAAIPINAIVARQNPWSVFVIAGTGLALLIYWLRYRKAVRELCPLPA